MKKSGALKSSEESMTHLFADIPFDLNTDQLLGNLRIKPGTDLARKFEELVEKIRETGRPKALYKVCYITQKGESTITVDGITFKSLALRKNLDTIERVFPYIATCGAEIDDLETGQGNFQNKLLINFLKAILLDNSLRYLRKQLYKRYKVSKISAMNPGAGDASVWAIEEQRKLFSLFEDVKDRIGVRLTKSLVIVPDMSVSGILFPTETEFQSCQLCHRENCRFRRTAFDKILWESMNQAGPKVDN